MATFWDVSTAVYEDKSKYIGSEDSTPSGLSFKSDDGTKMYMLGYKNNKVYQYTLSTAWDISTASYEDKYKDIGSEDFSAYDLFFKPDGTKMYIMGNQHDTVYQYSLSTPWEIETATYQNKYKNVAAQESIPIGLSFSSNGLKMYITGYTTYHRVYQYTLSTAWDISTASYEDKYKDVGDQDDSPYSLSFKSDDGLKMYIVGWINKTIYQYTLSTAWSVDTATYEDKSKYVGSEETYPFGIFFKPNGGKMYIIGLINDKVYQYYIPGAVFYQPLSGTFGFTGNVTKLTKKRLAGSSTFSGAIKKKVSITIQGTMGFVGTLYAGLVGRFLNATLSIAANESILSIAANESVLSIDKNESILSVEE